MADTGFQRPSLATILSRVQGDLNSALSGVEARLRRSTVRVLARVVGGAAHLLHGAVQYVSRQILPTTCDETYLPLHANIWQKPRRAAVAAAGPVTFTGTAGSVIPAGTVWIRADLAEFTTDAEATIPVTETIDVDCTASEAGAGGNTDAGVEGTLASPISGVSSTVTVAGDGLEGGLDEEDVEDWRARVVARIQEPPHGGAVDDYEAWALEVEGVDRVWVTRNGYGIGTVLVRFSVEGTGAGVIPGAGKVAEVQAYLDERAPVTAGVYVFAPVGAAQDFTLHVSPDTATIRAAIEAELEALFAREASPGGTIYDSQQRAAISQAAGEAWHTKTAPAGDIVAAAGELPYLGTVSWV